jgi:DNA modification methylase
VDDVVLDPFIGSGTTAVAAKQLGRHFVGFDISPDYCRLAEERIANAARLDDAAE